jgi:hypothetical protein
MRNSLFSPLAWGGAIAAAFAFAVAGCWWWLKYRRQRHADTDRALLLARDIVAISCSIDTDLQAAGDASRNGALAERCARAREPAVRVLASARSLRNEDGEVLQDRINSLHEAHRVIVDLRSELDMLLAKVRRRDCGGESQMHRFARVRLSSSFPATSAFI